MIGKTKVKTEYEAKTNREIYNNLLAAIAKLNKSYKLAKEIDRFTLSSFIKGANDILLATINYILEKPMQIDSEGE